MHGKKYAPVHGLESVAGIGQGPAHDDAHGIVQIGLAHFIFDIDLYVL